MKMTCNLYILFYLNFNLLNLINLLLNPLNYQKNLLLNPLKYQKYRYLPLIYSNVIHFYSIILHFDLNSNCLL